MTQPAWATYALPEPTSALAPFVEAGVFDAYEVHLVATLARLAPGLDREVVLALALAARAPRSGHVCSGLDAETVDRVAGVDGLSAAPLPWPEPESWERAVRESPLVGDARSGDRLPRPPLVWDLGRIYLQRLWHDELAVANELWRRSRGDAGDPRAAVAGSGADGDGAPYDEADGVEHVLDRLFAPSGGGVGGSGSAQPDRQRMAAARALRHPVSVIAGGPGTGKTHTVARILAAAHLLVGEGSRLSVAMAAPTGKAAGRMSEAVAGAVGDLASAEIIGKELAARLLTTPATTLHRLLGARGDASYAHDRRRPLPYDLVIVDETSMVSLPILARLVTALRPDARLVLVGDPFQLTSIEAGTVMSDVVGPDGRAEADAHRGHPTGEPAPLAGRVTVLEHVHRYASDSGIAAFATAVRKGDPEAVLGILSASAPDVAWVPPEAPSRLDALMRDLVAEGVSMVEAARRGDAEAALERAARTKVLCAIRRGRDGQEAWSERISQAVLGDAGLRRRRRWYAGRPILVTSNDPVNRLLNGDVGVVVEEEGRLLVAVRDGQHVRRLITAQLDRYEEWWAMTIHKSQGSEFSHAVVVLPPAGAPILSRELLYTAATRARDRLTVVSTEESLRVAVGRAVSRASGLYERLWPSPSP